MRSDLADVPAGLQTVGTAGRTLGALIYVQYEPPSPRAYHELMWISALVRCADRRYAVPDGWGPLYYVACSYVDDPVALEAGSEEWGLPRTAARFRREGNRIEVEGEDGTELALSFRPRGFSFTAPARLSTVQHKRQRIVRFSARGRSRTQLASYELERFVAGGEQWRSFHEALLLPGLASYLKSFDAKLHPAEELPRAMQTLRPAAVPF